MCIHNTRAFSLSLHPSSPLRKYQFDSRSSFALIIYAFGAFCTIGFLAQFHCQLVAMSETTNEKVPVVLFFLR